MKLAEKILMALRSAVEKAGGKPRLANKLGVSHSVINRFENGSRDINNMTVCTLEKLFPEIYVSFFGATKSNNEADSFSEREHIALEKKIIELEKKNLELEKHIFELEKIIESQRNNKGDSVSNSDRKIS